MKNTILLAIHANACSAFKVFNDTVADVFDYAKATHTELRDRLTTLNTRGDEIEAKYDEGVVNYSPEDAAAYKKIIAEMQATTNALDSRPEGLKEQRATLNVGPSAAALNTQLQSLDQRIRVIGETPDPRFGFKTDNEFMESVLNVYTQNKMDDRLKKVVINAVGDDEYSRGSWKSAGVLIPDGFLNSMLKLTPEDDQLLGRMASVPMSVPTLKIPSAVDKNHTTSFTGGTRVYRTSETRTVDKTKDQFEMVKMEATELVGESAATKELIRYSPISIPALINSSMELAMRYKRQDEIILGDGQGKYLGFLNGANNALISVARTPSQADSSILTGLNILAMRKRVWQYQDAVWVFNYDLFDQVAQLHIESPNAAGIIKLYAPANGDIPETLLGRPIVWSDFMPGIYQNTGTACTDYGTATNVHYAACVNMSQYLHGSLYTEKNQSVHVRFSEREEVFQFVMSDDARPWWLDKLTPKRGANTRSPFVALTNTSTE